VCNGTLAVGSSYQQAYQKYNSFGVYWSNIFILGHQTAIINPNFKTGLFHRMNRPAKRAARRKNGQAGSASFSRFRPFFQNYSGKPLAKSGHILYNP